MKRKRILLHLLVLVAAGFVIGNGVSKWQQMVASAKAMPLTTVSSLTKPESAPITYSVATSLSSYNLRVGHPKPTKELLQKAVYSETHKDSPTLGRVLRTLAASYGEVGESEISVDLSKRAAKLERSKGRFWEAAQNLQDIAAIYEKSGDMDGSIHMQQDATRLLRKMRLEIPLAAVLQHLAATFQKMGKIGDSKVTLAKAKKILDHHMKLLAAKSRPTKRSSTKIASAPKFEKGVGKLKDKSDQKAAEEPVNSQEQGLIEVSNEVKTTEGINP